MPAIFLPSPLDAPDAVAAIIGATPAALRPATLEGWGARADAQRLRVALVAGGEGARGSLLDADDDTAGRVGFAMAAIGAVPVPVTTGAGEAAVAYRFPAGAEPAEAEAGPAEAEDAARLVETLDEVMAHYGRRAPSEMPDLLHGIGIRALGRARGPGHCPPLTLGAPLSAGDVALMERRNPYTRYFAIEEHRLRHRRFDGGTSVPLDRAVFTSGDAVVVLPYDPHRDSVLLIEQFRSGPWARRDPRPWCLETVAGRCDRTEPVEATARREAREEAGLELGRVERIADFYPSPAIMSEFITAFVGEADLGAAGGVFGLAEEHEDIRAIVVPRAAALDAVLTGEIATAPLMIGLLWLDRNAGRLRREWT